MALVRSAIESPPGTLNMPGAVSVEAFHPNPRRRHVVVNVGSVCEVFGSEKRLAARREIALVRLSPVTVLCLFLAQHGPTAVGSCWRV